MRVSDVDPARRAAPHTVPGGRAPSGGESFRALLGGRTPLAAEAAREHLVAAYRAVTGRTPTAETTALLQAQWALETAGGRAMYGHNFGGIKAAEGGAAFRTREGHGAGEITTVARFRTYASAEAGALDYVALLARRYPGALEAANAGDLPRFASELASSGYYTASERSYRAALEHWRTALANGAPPASVADRLLETARMALIATFDRAMKR